MIKIKTLIVDDEPRAHKVLENYISRTPQLELTGSCLNAPEALEFLETHPVDLLFLDITMPEMDGFGLLNNIEFRPFVIFTTAHSEFALESYDYNAVDYLKKPIPFDRFSKAIGKLQQLIEKGVSFKPGKESIELKIDGKPAKILFNEILYLQSMGNYVKIYTENRMYVTQITTAEIEENLPHHQFLRIHKSFIVNKQKIESATDEVVRISSNMLPVGKTFKKYVKEQVNIVNRKD